MSKTTTIEYRDVSNRTPIPDAMSARALQRAGILIHGTAGRQSLAWMQRREPDPNKRSSADYLINRSGTILQVGRPRFYCYHAGALAWRGQRLSPLQANQMFIGVELENIEDGIEPITDLQYIACAALIRRLCLFHKLPVTNIDSHGNLAIPRGRKTDPKTLSWPILTRELISPSKEAWHIRWPEVLP